MCATIFINRLKEIETPKQFVEHFGFEPIIHQYYDSINPNLCLCQIDIDKTLKLQSIPFKKAYGGFEVYVGDLSKVIDDEQEFTNDLSNEVAIKFLKGLRKEKGDILKAITAEKRKNVIDYANNLISDTEQKT